MGKCQLNLDSDTNVRVCFGALKKYFKRKSKVFES